MLVLSRRINERIVIPEIDTTITIVEMKHSSTVRLGIEAPKDVTILREEIMNQNSPVVRGEFLLSREQAHALRNKLNSGTMGLGLLRKQIEAGSDAKTILATLERIAKGMSVEEAV